ncbi:adenylate cyclase [Thraustotheca clavata]|uniref:Adenylate cyclase n=1 Tax=Thraustotheca clavata TaxID=74557 RepID=A0A1V9ZQ26_9STRA|nr:adenylate cyclase [Thraustotheca clavata]
MSDGSKMVAYVAILSVSMLTSVATILAAFEATYTKNSAVQYVTYSIFFSDCFWSLFRLILYSIGLYSGRLPSTNSGDRTYTDSNRLVEGLVTVTGDLFMIMSSAWIILSAYEMRRLVTKAISRSEERERKHVVVYQRAVYVPFFMLLFAYSMCVAFGSVANVETALRISMYSVTFGGVGAMAYMLYTMYKIYRLNQKRHGFVDPAADHIAYRIKVLLVVYTTTMLPTLVITVGSELAVQCGIAEPFGSAGAAMFFATNCVYYTGGFFNAFSLGGSVLCCIRILRPVLPKEMHEQLLHSGNRPSDLENGELLEPIQPPIFEPVFVNTDIESSTYLWSRNPNAMAQAQSLHDDCMREHLAIYNGYEITTAGDAFELAFHNVTEAISWCIKVQKALMNIQWPKELEEYRCSKSVTDMFGRLIFRGLRVRMAIHLGDGQMIHSIHPTTGKMTYSGLDEIVAREVGDAGLGGQILISNGTKERFMAESDVVRATKKKEKRKMILYKDFFFRDAPSCHIADLNIIVPMSEIVPYALKTRFTPDRTSNMHFFMSNGPN